MRNPEDSRSKDVFKELPTSNSCRWAFNEDTLVLTNKDMLSLLHFNPAKAGNRINRNFCFSSHQDLRGN
ncbi:hypothetical protein ALT717_10246 [Alteromonas macleodii]